MHLIGHVAELWRYPVKSMGGERCAELPLTRSGIAGDRQLAFASADAPTGKPLLRAAQRAAMLRAWATLAPDGTALIHLPDLAAPLAAHAPDTPAHLAQALGLPSETAFHLIASPRPLTDVRPVALHSTAAIASLATEIDHTRLPGLDTGFDDRRLRSNLVFDLDPASLVRSLGLSAADLPLFPEDLLARHTLQISDHAQLQILERIPRCRIVSLAPGTASPDPHLLRHLARAHAGRAGIYARPLAPGLLREGDPVIFLA